MAVNKNIYGLVDKWLKFTHSIINDAGLCFLCGDTLQLSDHSLCTFCRQDLPIIRNACLMCGIPMPAGELCAHCIQERKPVINHTYCPFRYAYPVSKLIQDMKFHSRLDLVSFFAQYLAENFLQKITERPQCLIPIPLHSSRLRVRGYNQSLELAKHLSQILNIPVDNKSFVRTRKTRIQSELLAKQRKRNIKGAFAKNRTVLPTYNHIAIIDDVVTTGATVDEMARLIKKFGVERVDVWACARAAV